MQGAEQVPTSPRPTAGHSSRSVAPRHRRIPPDESVGNDDDCMPLALEFTDEDGAGFQAPVELRFLTAGESIEQLDCCSVEPAERLLLDAVSNHSRDEVSALGATAPNIEHQRL